jgi:hypothetical protein
VVFYLELYKKIASYCRAKFEIRVNIIFVYICAFIFVVDQNPPASSDRQRGAGGSRDC